MQCVDHDHEVYWKESAANLTWFNFQTQKPFLSFTCNQIKPNQRELKSNQNIKDNNNNIKSRIKKKTLTLSSSRAQLFVLGFSWAKIVERRARCWVMLLLQVTIAKGMIFWEKEREWKALIFFRIRECEIWEKGKGEFLWDKRDGEERIEKSQSVIFVNFVKLGKLGPSSPSLTDFDRVSYFSSFLPNFTRYICVDL
jgi:hypothetical protein